MSQAKTSSQSRSFWLKQLRNWHWISSAICLVGMILFAATGITLNHAALIEAKPKVTTKEAVLPEAMIAAMAVNPPAEKGPLQEPVAKWIGKTMKVDVAGREGEWSEDEVYVALARPGGDAWLSVDRVTGDISYEKTTRGVISYLNDLHKGRNTGPAWMWFIDVFAVACLVFCITGLCLLQMHAGARPSTWPMVGLGIVIPLVLAILFIHS